MENTGNQSLETVKSPSGCFSLSVMHEDVVYLSLLSFCIVEGNFVGFFVVVANYYDYYYSCRCVF